MGFRAKKQDAGSSQSQGVTIITAGCRFSGKLFCRGVSRIGGAIDGEIIAEGILIIEEDAVIDADIQASEVVIQGSVTGKLIADTRVELINSGSFSGELVTPSLHVEQGALLNGTTTMTIPASNVGRLSDLKNDKKNKAKNRNPETLEHSPALTTSGNGKVPEVGI